MNKYVVKLSSGGYIRNDSVQNKGFHTDNRKEAYIVKANKELDAAVFVQDMWPDSFRGVFELEKF